MRVAEAETGGRPYLREGHEAFVYTDRGVYRPGETVHLRTIVRDADGGTPTPFPLQVRLVRPDLRDWRTLAVTLDADGAAGLELELPHDLPTGRWTARVGLPGETGGEDAPFGTVAFQVEEFMPDRMKVALDLAGVKPSDVDDREALPRVSLGGPAGPLIGADVQADYLFGRPVAKRPGNLVARIDPAAFRPKKWAGWTFGDAARTAAALGAEQPLGRRLELPATDLDEGGHARWDVNVTQLIAKGEMVVVQGKPAAAAVGDGGGERYAGPWTLTATASVTEEGGRAVSATRRVEVDVAPHYLGVRAPGTLVQPRSPAAFDVVLVRPDGQLAADAVYAIKLEATLYREGWNNSLVHEAGRYRYETARLLEPVDGATADVSLAGGTGHVKVTCPEGGSYVLRVRDAQSGVVTSAGFYAGDRSWHDDVSREHPERLELVILPPGGPEAVVEALREGEFRKAIQSLAQLLGGSGTAGIRPSSPLAPPGNGEGEQARRFPVGSRPRVLVRSPFAGRLLLAVETDDVVATHVIDMEASQTVVPVEITEALRPNAYVTATVVRSIDPDADWRVHRAVGAIRLLVDNADRKLGVEITAPDEIRPATTLSAQVRVTDAGGNPVSDAPVTVAAVDEGICRLTAFATPDPFGFFTGVRALAVASADLYAQLMPEVPRPDAASAPGGDGGDDGRYRSPVAAKRVKPVALFSGVVRTDADGVARVDFPVPQFAGTLRLMAVAHRGGGGGAPGFGSGERAVTVRSRLIVQSSWPRFAAPGDRFTVPFVVFNNSIEAGEVRLNLSLDAAEAPARGGGSAVLAFAGQAAGEPQASSITRTLKVAAGGQAVTSVDVAALQRAGVARIRLVAAMGDETYEETVELPVRPASPTISTGGYLAASPGKPAILSLPGDMLEGTERLQLNVTPWPTLELPQGLDYLDRYPYGCAEQTISGLFPLVYLPDIGERIAPHVFDRERVAHKVQRGVIHLLGLRTSDGGVGMWGGARQSWPWASVYAAHFAVEARGAGHEIPDDLYDGLFDYCRTLLSGGVAGSASDGDQRLEAQAYACYVLALAGKPERAAMSRLSELLTAQAAGDEAAPAPHGQFHLAAAWLAAGRADLARSMIPDTLPAPRATRQLAGNVGSPVRDRALLLSTLLAVEPGRAELPALAQALADAGKAGQWQSTQDTAFAVMALGRYLRQGLKAEPYEKVELLRDGAVERTGTAGESIAWADDAWRPGAGAAHPSEVRVVGPAGAKAHVAWLRTGVPLVPPADADRGMKVRRRYLNDRGEPLAGDAVRSGDLVKVELTIESPSALANVVIEDLLPAGLEVENPRLVTQVPADQTAAAKKPDGGPQFGDDKLDVRDDRLIVVGHLTAAGRATYVYTARAVAPGTFAVPPVRAECMYDAGTSSIAGAGGTLRVTRADAAPIADVGRE